MRLAFAAFVFTAASAFAAESGRIVSASPSTFSCGQAKTVTVQVQNTGDSDDMFIEADSWPSGWSVTPKNVNPYITSGSYYNATFTVTPPAGGGSGAIVWKFYDDDIGVHPSGSDLLAAGSQSVSATGETVSTASTPTGPSSGQTGQSLSYSTGGATSSCGHSIQYRFDWGDGTFSTWSSSTSASKSWSTATTYTVRAQARCATHTSTVSSFSGGKSVVISPPPPVESGRIVSVSMPTFSCGQATTVTVQVQNTGESDDMIIEADSWPSGWSVTPKNVNPYITSGSYYNATFTVTPPAGGGSGTIVWKFYDDDIGVHPTGSDLLDTENQSVSATGETVSTPSTPTGPSSGQTGQSLSYSTGGASSSCGHSIQYRFDWGDGSFSAWSSSTSASKSWDTATTYTVRAQARCATHTPTVSSVSNGKSVVISPPPPVESGRIVSASPSTFSCGQATTVTVQVQNTGESDDMFIEADSWPSGWSVTPKNVNPNITSGSYYNATFTVTPPAGGGSGTIVWKFYDDDIGVHPTGSDLLDTENQSVSATGETVSTPSTPIGPSSGQTGQSLSYSRGGATSSCGHGIEYRFDWGDGTFSAWSSSASASKSWDTATTYTVRAQARCATHTAIVSASSSAITVSIALQYGNILARLKKVDSTDAPASGGTPHFKLYTSPVQERSGANPATFSNIPAGNYLIEGYQTGTFWGEEFWNSEQFTVVAGSTLNAALTRKYPYATSVVMKDVETGATITAGQTITAGTQVRFEVTVRNDVPGTPLSTQVHFALDLSQSGSFDYDWGLSAAQVISGSGGSKLYTFTTALGAFQTGQFYFALQVRTDTGVSIVPTDSWGWSQACNVQRVSRITGSVPPPPPWFLHSPVFLQRYPASAGAQIDPNLRTWIIIHGRRGSSINPWVSGSGGLAGAISSLYPSDQILLLDWTDAAADTGLTFFEAEDWIQPVATWAANKLIDYGFAGSDLNLIGHSWGGSLSAELAERIPFIRGHSVDFVNTIVALDPARNGIPGGTYNPDDPNANGGLPEIDFARNSRFSWAFHSSDLGSGSTPPTAHEAFGVNTDGLAWEAHSWVHDVFINMLTSPNPVSQRFTLARLLDQSAGARTLGPWDPDRYSIRFGIDPFVGGYEGVLTTTVSGQTPYSLTYYNQSTGLEVTEYAADTTRPTVTINQAAGQPDPTSSSPINFIVVFSEVVTGFGSGDVTLGGTARANSKSVSGGGTTYIVSVSGMTQSGTVTATIPAGAVQDAAGNPCLASTSSDPSVTYNLPDTTRPTVTINQAAGQSDPTGNSSINFTVVFSEAVTGFASSDVTLGGTAGATGKNVTGSGTTYNVAVSGMTQSGTVTATMPAGAAQDAAGNPSLASTSSDPSVTYNAPPQTGSLQVNLAPAGAVSSGAQWQVDGGAWQNSGATVSGLSVGSHTVAFNLVSGWTTPGNQSVTVNANVTTPATGSYVPIPQTGSLQVTITPAEAVSAGAQWRVDGGAWQNSGAAVSGLSVGSHTVAFNTMSGWVTPGNQNVMINANLTSPASGTYTTQTGSLQVNLEPAGAVSAGAQWQVDGGAWQNSGATVSGLSVGSHTVAFNTVNGWATPGNQTVTVNANQTTTASGTYTTQTGSLQVNLAPAGAISAGAQWQVDGGAWQNSGVTISGLSIGSHTVAFKTVTGWARPGNQNVMINANLTTPASGTYTTQTGSLQVNLEPAGAVSAGAQWQVDGGAWQNSGATVSGLSVGSHTVVFNTVSGWTTPGNQNVTVNANLTTPVTGTYVAIPEPPKQLTGMALSNGVFRFVLNGSVGSNYVIQVSSNAVNWLPLVTNVIPASGSVPITDPVIGPTTRFYRASPHVVGSSLDNDLFANRIAVNGAYNAVSGANVGATKETGEPNHGGNSGGKSVWWTWTAPSSGLVTMTTDASSFDTTLAVYTGNAVESLTLVDEDDDDGEGLRSRVVFSAIAGTAYQIAVDGFSDASGSITLTVKQGLLNDAFAERLQISGTYDVVSGSNVGGTREAGEPFHWQSTGSQSVWWTWQAPQSGIVTISTATSSFDTILAAYTGSSLAALSLVTNNDDYGGNVTSEISFSAIFGTVYQIAVDGFGAATGTIRISLSQP